MGLEKYAQQSRRPTGCPVCGEPNAGSVQIALKESGGRPKLIASRGMALCERHAGELWEEVLAAVEKRAS